jgi:pimeloyl-ACP methyl ester carboxylesterase
VPTLLIWGEQDMVFSKENLTGLNEYIQDLTIVRIADGSHWVIKQQPERVNSLIREFIESRNKA